MSFGGDDDSSVSHDEPLSRRTTAAFLHGVPGSAAPHQLSALDKVSALADQYQPGQRQQQAKSYTLNAPNSLTLQFPPQREIGRTEGGIIRSHSGRKAEAIFLTGRRPALNAADRPFPSHTKNTQSKKTEACFPLH